MFVEPRPPRCAHRVAGLQHRAQPRAPPSPHEAEMPAMLARHRLDDGIRLAVAPSAEHDRLVGPFHCCCGFLRMRNARSLAMNPAEAEGGIAVEEALGS